MRKFYTWSGNIVLVLVLIASQAEAWANWTTRLDIGGHVGLSSARFAGPGANGQLVRSSSGLGISVGCAMGIHVNDFVVAHTEIMFTLKRSHSFVNGVNFGTYYMKYLELPFLARVSLPIPGRVGYYGTMGPALGILLDADVDLADGSHIDLDRGFKRMDIGLMLGAGAAIDVGDKGALTFDIRYALGLRNIDENAAPENDDTTNRTFYFTVGYRANLDDLLHGFRRKAPPPARKAPSTPRTSEPDAAPSAAESQPAPTPDPPSSPD